MCSGGCGERSVVLLQTLFLSPTRLGPPGCVVTWLFLTKSKRFNKLVDCAIGRFLLQPVLFPLDVKLFV